MARQSVYPAIYPSNPALNTREACWEFLCLNQHNAREALVLFMNNEFNRLENVAMAKSSRKTVPGKVNEKATWTGFANIELQQKDKDAIAGGILDGDAVLEIMGDMLAEGHKIALSYDPERDTVSCAATGHYERCRNAGLTMTSFARDITTALLVMAYKHEVIAKGVWAGYVKTAKPKEDFG